MDNSLYKIAAATSTGSEVDRHFGKATRFDIYEVSCTADIRLLETRNVQPVCGEGGHNEELLVENSMILKDCAYVLVSRLGKKAADVLERYGVTAYEIPGPVDDGIQKLLAYININAMLNGGL